MKLRSTLLVAALTFSFGGAILISCTSRNPMEFKLNEYSVSLYTYETYQIEPLMSEGEVKLEDFKFFSYDESIASVSSLGLIEAKDKAGSTIIECTYLPSNFKKSISIVVNEFTKINKIECSRDYFKLAIGGSLSFYTSAYPVDSTFKELEMYVENEEIALVDDHKVTGLKTGATNLIIKAKEPGNPCSISVPITVSEDNISVPFDKTNRKRGDIACTYKELDETTNQSSLESVTTNEKTKVLLVPIEFKDYPFSSSIIDSINIAFNGTSEETNYWESVSSYFYKSSFGALNLEFVVLDVYRPSNKSYEELKSLYDPSRLITEGIKNHCNNHLNFNIDDFDIDDNGTIDAVVGLYSAPNQYNTRDENISGNGMFWAYSSYTSKYGSKAEPVVNKYCFGPSDMLETRFSNYDAHTFIHEMGHVLGLNDYYDYTYTASPLGTYDMQDYNVGDHNAWTKFAFGWNEPYIYETNKRNGAKIHINKATATGDAIVILDDYHNTAFDEMLVIELFTNDGLNAVDSAQSYNGISPIPDTYGIKLYHVDSRLITKRGTPGKTEAIFIDYSRLEKEGLYTSAIIGPSNSKTMSATKDALKQITFISKNETPGSYFHKPYTGWTADDLFRSGDSFTMEKYKAYFINEEPKLNDGTYLNIEISFENVTEDGADVIIQNI